MPLRLTLQTFYNFILLSPILISGFLLFMGFYNGSPQGVVYLLGTLVNHIIGMGFKSFFQNILDF